MNAARPAIDVDERTLVGWLRENQDIAYGATLT
jgi:hypothetical protein